MKVAVLSLTRDRLAYTQHCFATLREHAGCDYDHYVVDQASTDGTAEWLNAEWLDSPMRWPTFLLENIGICRALNQLLSEIPLDQYDVIVRFDNDCEVTQPDTLLTAATIAHEYGLIVSPRVLGLRNPPPTLRTLRTGDHLIDETAVLGGIFMAVPTNLFTEHGFRYDETQPLWAGDELICPWWRARGGQCGYLHGFDVNHYLTTDGQAADIPEYFDRRIREGGPAR